MSTTRNLALGAAAALSITVAAAAAAATAATGCTATTTSTMTDDYVAAPPAAAASIDWSTTLQNQAGEVGTRMSFVCPPGGSPNSVWGTDMYSDDSSICTAAAHAGLITFDGGVVNVVVQPGQSSYAESTRNGISTMSYGNWGRSYSFIP